MSRDPVGQFVSRTRSRKLAGQLFSAACFLATSLGVVILLVLVAAVISAASQAPGGLRGLGGLASRFYSSDPSGKSTGFIAGIA